MSEDWRRKDYYKTRVLIDTARVLDPQFKDGLLCITGAQNELLRNLMQYLKRRSTFASEYHPGYYLAPTIAEWDELQAIVADLEETLMGCDDLVTALQAIAANTACICQATSRATRDGPALPALVDDGLDDGKLAVIDDNGGTVAADADRCALAQLNYWLAWELLTEVIQPLQDALTDVLMPAAFVAIAAMCGTTIVGIPAGALLAWLWNLAEIWESGEMVNLQNTYRAYEDELICAVYRGLETNYDEAHHLAKIEIDAMADTSELDKLVFAFLFSPWALKVCQTAKTTGTDWAIANILPGRCDDCNIIEGSDWWALYLPEYGNTIEMDHPQASNWISGCWEYVLPTGWITNGVIIEVKNKTGNCQLKRMGAAEAGCSGSELWGNTSDVLADGDYFCVMGDAIDEAECKATLSPDAIDLTDVYSRTGPVTINGGFHLGWNCEGAADIHVKWLIMRGSIP